MKRLISYLSIITTVFILFSCETGDPAQVYGWTPNPGINGPRIMTKVDSASVTQYEFLSTSFGVVEHVNVYQSSGIDKQNVYYNTPGKIANIKINELTPDKTVVNLSYDANTGKLHSITQENYEAAVETSRFSSMLSYNAQGKLVHIEKLTKYPQTSPDWVTTTLIDLTYDGVNLVKIEENSAPYSGGTPPTMDPNTKITYEFENFDNKNNPFATMPSEYNITMGVMSTLAFHKLSLNNFFKMTKQVGSNVPEVHTWGAQSVVYDDQGYPVTDQSGVRKFTYKAIP